MWKGAVNKRPALGYSESSEAEQNPWRVPSLGSEFKRKPLLWWTQ